MSDRSYNDDIILVAVKDGYHFYYDNRNKQKLCLTPRFHFSRYFNHCCSKELADWADNQIEEYIKATKGFIKNDKEE